MNITINYNDEAKNLREVAARTIALATTWLERIHTLHELFVMKPFASSFINNTKDALFHYRRLDIAYNDYNKNPSGVYLEKMLLEFEFISEHLTRGIIDALVDSLQYISQYYVMVRKCIVGEIHEGSLSDAESFLEKLDELIIFCRRETLQLRRGALDRITKIDDKGIRMFNLNYGKYICNLVQKCANDHKELASYFIQPLVKDIFRIVEEAITEDCAVHRITSKNERTLNAISRKYSCHVMALKVLNGLEKIPSSDKLDGSYRWILYPV